MIPQELTDRLVVATEEQDVLYTLHWLTEMKQQDCLEQAINNKHSWKGYSALESIIESPFSQLRKFILQMLLLQGVDGQSRGMLDLAMECKNLEVLGMILTWETTGREAAGDAARLFDMTLQEAGDWIDSNLPTPPNFDSLTGFKPLPAPPSPLSARSSDFFDSPVEPLTPQVSNEDARSNDSLFVKEEETESNAPSLRDFSPSPFTSKQQQDRYRFSSSLSPVPSSPFPPPFENPFQIPSPVEREQDQHQTLPLRSVLKRRPRQSSNSDTRPIEDQEDDISLPSLVSPVRLCLRRLPFGFTPQDVSSLVESIGVKCLVDHCYTAGMPAYAFIQVEGDQVQNCLSNLDQRQVKHCRISCHIASPDRNPRRSFSQQRQKWSPPQIDPFFPPDSSSNSNPSSSTFILPHPEGHNLLILNLPLNETLEARQFLSNLPAYSIHLLPSHSQAVAFLRLESEEKADEIKSLWNRCVVDGRCLEVVNAKSGLGGKEAVDAHFGLKEEGAKRNENGKRRMSQQEMFEACRSQGEGKRTRYSI